MLGGESYDFYTISGYVLQKKSTNFLHVNYIVQQNSGFEKIQDNQDRILCKKSILILNLTFISRD